MTITTNHPTRNKIIIGAVIAATFIAGISLGSASAKPDYKAVYAACDRAHVVTTQTTDKEQKRFTDGLWQTCGDLQAKTNTEYVCGQAGTCWLEVK